MSMLSKFSKTLAGGVLVSILVQSQAAYSLPMAPPPNHMLPPVVTPPLVFSIKNKTYSLEAAGVERFMNDIKKEEPKVYSQLLPQYEELARNESIQKWSTRSAVFIAFAPILVSIVDPKFSTKSAKMIMPSLVLAGALYGIGEFFRPGTSDYLDLINNYKASTPNSEQIFTMATGWSLPFQISLD